MALVVPIQTYAFILAFGLGSAGTLPTIATLGNDLFSIRERAVAWGFLEAAYAVGAALGAWSVGWLFDRSGDYFSSLCLVALSLGGSYFFVMALSPSSASKSKLR
jgi:MFS family permease